MSIGSAIAGILRAVVITAATGAAAFGLLVVFHPFNAAAPKVSVSTDMSTADVLREKIAAAREALRQTELNLDNVKSKSPDGAPAAGDASAQYEAQIAAAAERRDLALRHAKAIRDRLTTKGDLSSLSEIRDSVVIGQLFSQQSALDAKIAEQGTRFKPNHPTMRALYAQRKALGIQIESEAASIASSLEAEAKLDDAQIKLLQSQLTGLPVTAPSVDVAKLEAQVAAQRAELDTLMDAYFALKPSTTVTAALAPTANALAPLNLYVIGVAMLSALAFQIWLSIRRARLRREALDMQRWHEDQDPDIKPEPIPVSEEDQFLRRAS